MKKLLREIKQAFHELCGVLSIDELTTNRQLIDVIARLEKMLVGLAA